ncbi:MAG TPA: hypothetical protein VNS81_00210 [Nocardioides sp.]|nr:hypothetical protein [Nocardioides sp.]
MSSASPPLEFFFDRSLGKRTAEQLRGAGWAVHLVADSYPDDAQAVGDEEWLAEGCRHGWILLTKDKRIRYRGGELAAMYDGRLFCLANGNLPISEMAHRFLAASASISRGAAGPPGFWHIYENGRTERRWP